MSGIDLTGARERVVGLLMTDTCTVTQDVLHLSDASYDPVTMQLVPNSNNDTEVYSGPCQLVAGAAGPTVMALGLAANLNSYTLRLPWDEGDGLRVGNYVTMTESEDPTLTGKKLQVRHVVRTNLLVWREAVCDLLEADRG